MLEGLHAVTAFKPDLMSSSTDFQEQLVSQVKAIACGRALGAKRDLPVEH
jgi:hypothetical protein